MKQTREDYQKNILKILKTSFKVQKLYDYQNFIREFCMQSSAYMRKNDFFARDVQCYVPTGSGKTLAYVLPIVDWICRLKTLDGVYALVLVPTRELVLQTYSAFLPFSDKIRNFSSSCIDGTLMIQADRLSILRSRQDNSNEMGDSASGFPNVLVCLASRLPYIMLENESFYIDVFSRNLRFLIFDEVDNMLTLKTDTWVLAVNNIVRKIDMQRLDRFNQNSKTDVPVCFEFRKNVTSMNPSHIIVQRDAKYQSFTKMIFTATPVTDYNSYYLLNLVNPITVSGGLTEKYARRLKLRAILTNNDTLKLLADFVHKKISKSDKVTKILIFAKSHTECVMLHSTLEQLNIDSCVITGKTTPSARRKVLRKFRHSSKVFCLISTDLAARGLNITNLKYIFHYGIPSDSLSYVHRLGRIARAKGKGKSYIIAKSTDEKVIKKLSSQSKHLRVGADNIKIKYLQE